MSVMRNEPGKDNMERGRGQLEGIERAFRAVELCRWNGALSISKCRSHHVLLFSRKTRAGT
jgi:hypothetical protein